MAYWLHNTFNKINTAKKSCIDLSLIHFGSISPKQIVEELKNKGYEIDKKQININGMISSLGFHNVDIILHKKVIAQLKIELKK